MKKYPTIWEASEAVAKALKSNVLGNCYTTSVAIYFLTGKNKKLKLYGSNDHYWLRGPYGVFIDLTAGQFHNPIPHYLDAIEESFPRSPEREAQYLMRKAKTYLK